MYFKLKNYLELIRLNKPIGIFLLLWPTLWAIWLASNGDPSIKITLIFITGTVIMRSLGCIINDLADKDIDKHVKRTQNRPLTSGRVSSKEAIVIFALLLLCAFILVLQLNRLTIFLAFIGAGLTIIYPFLKRITHLPQTVLGLAMSWGIPMAYAAIQNHVPAVAWLLFFSACCWTIAYDTMYAMVDKEDDMLIGVKSTAILFGHYDRLIIFFLEVLFLSLLLCVAWIMQLHHYFYLATFLAMLMVAEQMKLIHHRSRKDCLQAFINNHWIGLIIFVGIFISLDCRLS
ncbi:MAG: 4-hydroxybenzoate octaprenyltransferase [Pseudomonadota bacterium]